MMMTALISILLIHIILVLVVLVALVVREENSVFGHAQSKNVCTASANVAA